MFEQLELDLGLDVGSCVTEEFKYEPTQDERRVNQQRKWSLSESKAIITNYLMREFLKNKVLEYKQTEEQLVSGWSESVRDADYFQQGTLVRQRDTVNYKHTHFINNECELVVTEIDGVNYKYQVKVKRKDTLVYDIVLGVVYLNGVKVADTEEGFVQV